MKRQTERKTSEGPKSGNICLQTPLLSKNVPTALEESIGLPRVL